MNLVYDITTDDFQPISFGDSYLYDNYGRLSSFLKFRLSSNEINRLAKPVLNATKQIEWHSAFDGPMHPLDSFPQESQVDVEKQYLELLKKIERTIVEFRNSQDKDKEQWSNILSLVFNPADNKLLYNGKDWIFMWGWQFRNKLIIQSPEFNIPEDPIEQDTVQSEIVNTPELQNELEVEMFTHPDDIKKDELAVEEEKLVVDQIGPITPVVPQLRKRISFWERIKRFFRWIAYRLWGLMMLIIFVLLILCLCKNCCQNKEDCSTFENVDKELKRIEDRVKERCPEIKSEPASEH